MGFGAFSFLWFVGKRHTLLVYQGIINFQIPAFLMSNPLTIHKIGVFAYATQKPIILVCSMTTNFRIAP